MGLINRITNANIYVNGANFLGKAEEVELPQPKSKEVEFKGLGLWGSADLPAGMEKLEAKIKWTSLYDEVLKTAFLPMAYASIMVRADMMQFAPGGLQAEVPVVALMMARFKVMPSFKVVKHENSESSSELAVIYYKLMLAGQDEVEIDVFANIYKVGGIDQLNQFRANQGG